MDDIEYSASGIRKILQQLFPHRRLVLSQFTFFNQIGVARASGSTFRRGRRCYKLEDLLSIACVLALKEEGIPLKNICQVPQLIQENALRIFTAGANCRLIGYKDLVALQMPNSNTPNPPLEAFLAEEAAEAKLFWSYDVGLLAMQLRDVAYGNIPAVEVLIAA